MLGREMPRKLAALKDGSMSVAPGRLPGMSKPVRTDPPSTTPNNQDTLIYALYQLGGADSDISVEEVCLKCFEIAPARFSWRTHPEYPDGVKGLKALSVAENKSHVGLIFRPNKFNCRLTLEGIKWVETYLPILESTYSKAKVQASKTTNQHERKRQEIKNSEVWKTFKANPGLLTKEDFASVLQCSAASSETTWRSRVHDVKRAADILQDEELMSFALSIELAVLGNGE